MKKRKNKKDSRLKAIMPNIVALPLMAIELIFGQPKKNKRTKLKTAVDVVIIGTLLGFWLVCSLFFVRQTSFTVLDIVHKTQNASDISGRLMKGSVYRGEFMSDENGLGILKVKFKDLIRVSYSGEDILQFRIKEKGQKDWYYLNNYRSGQLVEHLQFPFGFPIIPDSKGKVYVFEIESLLGNDSNAVTIDKDSLLVSGHQLTKQEAFGNKKSALNFIYRKTTSSLTNPDFLLNSTIFLLPLFVFLLIRIFYNKLLKGEFLAIATLVIIALDLLVIKEVYPGILIGLIFMWIFSIWMYKLESSVTFFFAFLIITIWLCLMIFNVGGLFSKYNIWAYTFLTIGTLQLIYEARSNSKRVSYRKFFDKIIDSGK